MEWVTQITTISLEMSLPAAGGYWLDKQWGSAPWLMIIGAALGFYVAMKHLMALTQKSKRPPRFDRSENSGRPDGSTQQRDTDERNE